MQDDPNGGVTVVGPVAFAGLVIGPVLLLIGAVGGLRLSGWPAIVSWIVCGVGLIWLAVLALKLLTVWRLVRFLRKNDYLE